jgi:hypothetical protein
MSDQQPVGAPVGYQAVDVVAPDQDQETLCPGCKRLTCQVSWQPVYITFGYGYPIPSYGAPEPYLPFMGQLLRDFDAFKVRAYTPLAQIPAGQRQAQVKLIPLVSDG